MKMRYSKYYFTLAFLASASCGAATFQTKDFTLRLPGDWHATPAQVSDHANSYTYAKPLGGGLVAVLVTNAWAGSKQDKASLQDHVESLTRACLQSQYDEPLPRWVTPNRCEVAGTSGLCAEFERTQKIRTPIKGICMGWSSRDNLIYTVSWFDALPEAEDELPKMDEALKSIKLPQKRAPTAQ